GFKVIRFDYSGIGDSQMRMDNVSYEKSVIEETREFMDYLSTANDIDEFILMGICSGADNAFRIAGVDDRVSGCLFIDSFSVATAAFFWRTYARRFISIRSWFLLLTGKSDLWQALRRYISSNERNGDVLNPLPDPPSKDEILADIKKMLDRGVEMCFIYSGGASYYNYLVNFKPHFQKLQLHNFKTVFFKRADHTFTLVHYQQALMQAITEWLSCFNEKRCA
ncbi:MAG: alpha/beta fold hydrolase, partial [bacterium]